MLLNPLLGCELQGVPYPPTGATAFLGLRYAQPPVGELRWQPPVQQRAKQGGCSGETWAGAVPGSNGAVANATVPAPSCLQKGRFGNGTSSEDCLTLTVFTQHHSNDRRRSSLHSSSSSSSGGGGGGGSSGNRTATEPTDSASRPVFVWLHGGDLIEGGTFSIQSGYGAIANITGADADSAVVVSVEYRLGVAGFLALDCLADRDARGGGKVGNYGLLDVIAALEWVQANIDSFGGDPGNVTVIGQSSGGSLVFALLASPQAARLVHRGISMSGSPRLNSTTAEAARYWHREVVGRTRCSAAASRRVPRQSDKDGPARDQGIHQAGERASRRAVSAAEPAGAASRTTARETAGQAECECLLGLSGAELIAAIPPDWTADVWSFKLFGRGFQYAPLLLIDGPGGVLPASYIDTFGTAETTPNRAAEVIVGVTRQEPDFSPGKDVRNYTAAAFAAFLREAIAPTWGASFVDVLIKLYISPRSVHASSASNEGIPRGGSQIAAAAFEPQRVFAEIITDANVLCPSLYLAAQMQRNRSAPVSFYAVSQRMEHPFCALQAFNSFNPPYCPLFSPHAIDMFPWFQPAFDAVRFNYSFTKLDRDFAALVQSRFVGFTASHEWPRVSNGGEPFVRNALPGRYVGVDFAVGKDAGGTAQLKQAECAFWLAHGFYDSALIN